MPIAISVRREAAAWEIAQPRPEKAISSMTSSSEMRKIDAYAVPAERVGVLVARVVRFERAVIDRIPCQIEYLFSINVCGHWDLLFLIYSPFVPIVNAVDLRCSPTVDKTHSLNLQIGLEDLHVSVAGGESGDAVQTSDSDPWIDPADIDLIVQDINAFVFEVFQRIRDDEGNIFFSPYSLP